MTTPAPFLLRERERWPLPPVTRRYLLLSLVSGVVWGLIGYALGRPYFPDMILPALLVSPLIGLAIGYGFRWIHRLSVGQKAFVSLIGLYLAGALFGLVIGFADLARDVPPELAGRKTWAVLMQPIFAVWWALTFGGWFLAFWPLSYLNHHLLGKTL